MALRELREKRGMTRRELADISGISFRSIQDYEQRHKTLASAKGETLYRFSQVLDCTVEELLEGEPLIAEIDREKRAETLRRLQAYSRMFAERFGVHGSWTQDKDNRECGIPPTIAIGAQSFEKLRMDGNFFIDKSLFIREWWERRDEATLIVRPRRFGKTLNLSMLNCFFSNRYAGRSELFEGLKIWELGKYRGLQGTWPVICLSFANVRGSAYEEIRRGVMHTIVELYLDHRYIRDSGILDEKECAFWDMIEIGMTNDVAMMAIHNLTAYLYRYNHKRVLIFLDEYDTPLQEAYLSGCWDEMSGLFRGIFQAAVKTNPCMERALLTGTTRIGKESMFSELNNLYVVTASSEKYAGAFGFTEAEVRGMLQAYGLEEEFPKVKEWYDGYIFGRGTHIYNPWSITHFLEERTFRPYWANTSSNRLVGTLLMHGSDRLKQALEDLLMGGCICAALDEEVVFSQLDRDEDAVWSFLLAGGYLRIEKLEQDERTGVSRYTLALSSRESGLVLRQLIRDWFQNERMVYNAFVEALLSDNVDYMNAYMNEISERVFSYFDVESGRSKYTHPERFYHGFVLGLIVELEGRYRITSNRESGLGRYDVVMEPLDRQDYAYVLEFKVRNAGREATLEDTVAMAHAQIAARNYRQTLLDRGIEPERILSYAFAFQGKKVLIG